MEEQTQVFIDQFFAALNGRAIPRPGLALHEEWLLESIAESPGLAVSLLRQLLERARILSISPGRLGKSPAVGTLLECISENFVALSVDDVDLSWLPSRYYLRILSHDRLGMNRSTVASVLRAFSRYVDGHYGEKKGEEKKKEKEAPADPDSEGSVHANVLLEPLSRYCRLHIVRDCACGPRGRSSPVEEKPENEEEAAAEGDGVPPDSDSAASASRGSEEAPQTVPQFPPLRLPSRRRAASCSRHEGGRTPTSARTPKRRASLSDAGLPHPSQRTQQRGRPGTPGFLFAMEPEDGFEEAAAEEAAVPPSPPPAPARTLASVEARPSNPDDARKAFETGAVGLRLDQWKFLRGYSGDAGGEEDEEDETGYSEWSESEGCAGRRPGYVSVSRPLAIPRPAAPVPS